MNTKEIFEYYNGTNECIICKTHIPYKTFFRGYEQTICSKKCYIKNLSNRMQQGLNPHDLSDFASTPEYKQKLSDIISNKIKKGVFTPCATNSWCRSRIVVDNIPFRSSWEAYFYIYKTYIDKTSVHFEKLRIQYYSSINQKNRTYIVDFIDYENKIVYEIKPEGKYSDTNNASKHDALIKWGYKNNYRVLYISEDWFRKNFYEDIMYDNIGKTNITELIAHRLKQFNKNTTEITSIENFDYQGDTYNLHVEDNHNYFAEGMCVSNCHGLKFENKSTDIVYNAYNAQYRIGVTGTLPEDQIAKMAIMACVGAPKRYIKTQGLIERGLATPVHINVLHLKYNNSDKSLFKYVGNFAKQLQFVKEHQNRNVLVAKLSNNISVNGNTVVLCSHVQHMKDIYIQAMKHKFPDVVIENKHITGTKAVEFQEQYHIYYIAGATSPKDREKIFTILKNNSNAVLISNYQLLSTGINIKSLKNIVFASPLKSYTTITQSIGRAIRTHISKNTAEIYDLVDDFSARGNSGPFYRQYHNRVNLSYLPEGFPMTERNIFI